MSNSIRHAWGKPRGKWNARGAAIKQKQRHDIKLGFKTRLHGSSKQIGQIFPTGQVKKLPSRMQGSKSTAGWMPAKDQSNFKKEKIEKLNLGKNDYAVNIVYKNGKSELKRISAKDFDAALDQTDLLLNDKLDVRSVSILSGGKIGEDITELAHKVGSSSAWKFGTGVAKGLFNSPPPPTDKEAATPESPAPPERTTQGMGEMLGNWTRKQIEATPKRLGEASSWESRQKAKYEAARHAHDPDYEIQQLHKQLELSRARDVEPLLKQAEIEKLRYQIAHPEMRNLKTSKQLTGSSVRARINELVRVKNNDIRTLRREVAKGNMDAQADLAAELDSVSRLKAITRKTYRPSDIAAADSYVTAEGGKRSTRNHKVSFSTKQGKVSFLAGGKKPKAKLNWRATTRAVSNMPNRKN